MLENHTIFGTVNANRKHYETGAQVLARADRAWLRRLIRVKSQSRGGRKQRDIARTTSKSS